jgi:hypothetical protein
MHRALHGAVMVLTLVVASGTAALGASVCTPIGDGKLRCAIKTISDCNAIVVWA